MSRMPKRRPVSPVALRTTRLGVMSGNDMEVVRINERHGELEAHSAHRLDRRHMLEVVRYMPHIRACKKDSRPITGVPKAVLDTAFELCLV